MVKDDRKHWIAIVKILLAIGKYLLRPLTQWITENNETPGPPVILGQGRYERPWPREWTAQESRAMAVLRTLTEVTTVADGDKNQRQVRELGPMCLDPNTVTGVRHAIRAGGATIIDIGGGDHKSTHPAGQQGHMLYAKGTPAEVRAKLFDGPDDS